MSVTPRPFIIGGVPRSGTTLLAKRCGRHPDMSVSVELASFLWLGSSYPEYSFKLLRHCHRNHGRWRFDGGEPMEPRQNHRTNIKYALSHLGRLGRRAPRRVTVDDLAAAAADPSRSVMGDKLPRYIYHLPRLAREPNLARIIIYRDPRDVVSSFLRKVRGDWQHMAWTHAWDSAEKIAGRWVEAIELMEAHAEYVHVLCYEELVNEARAGFEQLAEWLGVSAREFDTEGISRSNIGKYERGLTSSEIDDVVRIAGPTMERLGYH